MGTQSEFLFLSILKLLFPSRMTTMGENMEQSNLYLKLFKLVFGSVTLFAQENELMLKVNRVEMRIYINICNTP